MSLQLVVSLLLSNLSQSFENGLCNFNRLVNDLNSLDSGIHDIGILKLTTEDKEDSKINDIMAGILQCIPKENPIILPNDPIKFNSTYNELNLRKLAFTFVIVDDILNDLVSSWASYQKIRDIKLFFSY
jgi:hypothetical protein